VGEPQKTLAGCMSKVISIPEDQKNGFWKL
jgi:hypothetical protein